MRTIYLLISFSIYCLHVLGQTDTEIIYKSTSNNAYYMHYYSGFVSIGNNVYPLSGKENPLNWQDWYHFDKIMRQLRSEDEYSQLEPEEVIKERSKAKFRQIYGYEYKE